MTVCLPEKFPHQPGCATSRCRIWQVTRQDGVVLGFTDHDQDIDHNGSVFQATAGLTGKSLDKSIGLSVDNSAALGVLADDRISAKDINAGLFDGAQLIVWDLNWQNHDDVSILFSGSFGEIRRTDLAFEVEIRGLTEALNQPQGRVYQKSCTAVLGDKSCGVDLTQDTLFALAEIQEVWDATTFVFSGLNAFPVGWFARGAFEIEIGHGKGLRFWTKSDEMVGDTRVIKTWEPIRAGLKNGDVIRLEAGCDKRCETCKVKFNNIVNYQGFPYIPGDNWLTIGPGQNGQDTGGSLFS